MEDIALLRRGAKFLSLLPLKNVFQLEEKFCIFARPCAFKFITNTDEKPNHFTEIFFVVLR